MKLYLVMSDTHGNLFNAEKVIVQYPKINGIIHLGDYYSDAVSLKKRFSELDFYMVSGNCDFSLRKARDTSIKIDNVNLLLTHGHNYRVKSGTELLEKKAIIEGFNAVLFGHTHIPLIKYTLSNILILNPGSLGYPRGISGPTYALLEVSKGNIEARILEA
jgi:putative phosphoesterase